MIRTVASLAPAVLWLLLSPCQAAWGAERDVERGGRLAAEKCGRCHALGREGASPHRAAPPFRDLHKRWPLEALEEALAEGITTGHPDMPEFRFEPDEIAALIAFMKSLAAARDR